MKQILTAVMVIGIMAMLAGTGTFAYFVDAEASIGDTATAGTLDLKIDGGDINVVMFDETVERVDSGYNEIILKNEGSIDGYLDITCTGVVDEENGLVDWENWLDDETSGELAEGLNIKVYINGELKYDGPVKNIAGGELSDYPLDSGEEMTFRIEWETDIRLAAWLLFGVSDITGFNINFELAQTPTEEGFIDIESSNGNTFTAALG